MYIISYTSTQFSTHIILNTSGEKNNRISTLAQGIGLNTPTINATGSEPRPVPWSHGFSGWDFFFIRKSGPVFSSGGELDSR